jgi:hypothetical protein
MEQEENLANSYITKLLKWKQLQGFTMQIICSFFTTKNRDLYILG